MRLNLKKASQALALLLICAVTQVFVMAAPATPNNTKENASGALILGRLSTFGPGKVAVNGSIVPSGTTILSGTELQTSDTAGAEISLGAVGKLDIAPKTKLTLAFDRNSISVNVASGEAILTANEGVKGSLTTPDGKTKVTDGKGSAALGTAMYTNQQQQQQGSGNRCEIADIPCWLFWTLVGGGTLTAVIIGVNAGDNPSESTP